MEEQMRSNRSALIRRALATVGISVAAGLLVGGCSQQASDTLPKPDAKKAATELQTGLTAQSKGDLETAAKHYQEALKYDTKNKYALYDLALIDAARSNYGEAEKKYRVVLGIDPAYTPALFNLAILLKNQGNTTEATSLYRRLLTADPKNASAHMNLGLLLRQAGQQAEGDAEVKQAVTLNPQLKDPAAG
jgi:tetratricopeptide (TPR) repeat protein